ncbi:hypothetical protein [Campylobacter curvus]|uniref:hypothetical protein n=1 Tax=Campylobacter curvus TaxID=200 RepID=UPI00147005BA|nr:hypothetical protein [Campylobacter curvus]
MTSFEVKIPRVRPRPTLARYAISSLAERQPHKFARNKGEIAGTIKYHVVSQRRRPYENFSVSHPHIIQHEI